ncbi:MAG TPA: site-specific DNA-methyltransferase [Caldisericia bacterium]|nr:site-specific DNA-methyltransferase [Caldisericia bacterium]
MDIKKINKMVKTDIKEGLKNVFPEVFEDNKVNFEKLKSLLSGEIIEKEDDRFYFNWAGKNNIFKLIQAPAYGTLKPDKEKSIDFDKTENIVIVGENLETLKLLLKPYFGKVKMIYIDPPYNTGKDFIYRDNFKEPVRDYLEKTGQIDSEGQKLTTNTEASGRYHSDWLNFMYPRLFLARSLLRDDGVIFISIDDHEVHHLRMVMDEIFGEENFVANIIWHSKGGAGTDPKTLSIETEYVLLYAKNKPNVKLNKYTYDTSDYNLRDEYYEVRGCYKLNKLDRKSLGYIPSLDFPIELNGLIAIPGGTEEENKKRIWRWRWSKGKVNWGIRNGFIVLKEDKSGVVNAYYKIYEKVDNEGNPIGRTRPYDNLVPDGITTSDGTAEIEDIFGIRIMDYPKPTELMSYLIKIALNTNDIILDFFAGSGTTGHAVWDLNKEDGGNRKFILVQLDEEVKDEEIKKEFPAVADICIERLSRVSEKYKKEVEGQLIDNNQDFGFKVFRLDKSNFNLKDEFEIENRKDVEELKKKYLEWLGIFVDQPLVSGWQKIDIIYEVMLKEGLNLNSQIEKMKIKDDEFYYVKDNEQNLDFYISLQYKFAPDTIEEIRTSKYKGKMFVFLDNALTDSDKINLITFVRLKVI